MRWDAETASEGCNVSEDGRTMWVGTTYTRTGKGTHGELRCVQSTHALQDCVGLWRLDVQMKTDRCKVHFGGSRNSLVESEGGTRSSWDARDSSARDSFYISYDHRDRRLSRSRRWECETAQCGLFDHFVLAVRGPCVITIHDANDS